jgi:hypothetical protein
MAISRNQMSERWRNLHASCRRVFYRNVSLATNESQSLPPPDLVILSEAEGPRNLPLASTAHPFPTDPSCCPGCPIYDGLIVMSGYRAQPDRSCPSPPYETLAVRAGQNKSPNHPQKQPKIRVSTRQQPPNLTKPAPPLPISLHPTWHSYPTYFATIE